MTDADFLREFRKGNKEAFSGLVEKYSKPITMMILRMVKDLEEARDISQTVFLKAYEGLPTFMMNSSFKTWLYRIAMNAANDYIRKRKPNIMPDSMDDFAGPAASPGEQLDRLRYLEQLKRAIEELPEKQRLTLQMRIYDELNYKEIAKVLGGTAGSARGNFFQATRTLRLKLGSGK
jgi:RNA polymerase sigma-70 factor, ECF subfamily